MRRRRQRQQQHCVMTVPSNAFLFPPFLYESILFGDFEAYPVIFEPFGFNTGEQGLAFIPIAIGLFCTTSFVPLIYSRYMRITRQMQEKKKADGDKNWESATPPPEERLVWYPGWQFWKEMCYSSDSLYPFHFSTDLFSP
jgi:hypothetical protein